MFQAKRLTCMWSTYTMDGRVKSLDGNQYSQVFSNGTYFAEIYPIAKKDDAGEALETFVMEPGVPEEMIIDVSKKQNRLGTEFMKCCQRNDISLTRTEHEIPNQNPAERVIREVPRQWFRTIMTKKVPINLLDYGLQWTTQFMKRTFTQAGELMGTSAIQDVTGKTPNISEYLYSGFYDHVSYKKNAVFWMTDIRMCL